MAALSCVSLGVSLLGIAAYFYVFVTQKCFFLFVLLAVASMILPVLAKRQRVRQGKKGKGLEIAAIILAGYNFYFVIYLLGTVSLLWGCLGWAVTITAYRRL